MLCFGFSFLERILLYLDLNNGQRKTVCKGEDLMEILDEVCRIESQSLALLRSLIYSTSHGLKFLAREADHLVQLKIWSRQRTEGMCTRGAYYAMVNF